MVEKYRTLYEADHSRILELRAENEKLRTAAHDERTCSSTKKVVTLNRQLLDKAKELATAYQYSHERETSLKTELPESQQNLAMKQKKIDSCKKDLIHAQGSLVELKKGQVEEIATLMARVAEVEAAAAILKLDYNAVVLKSADHERKIEKYSSAFERHKKEYIKLKESRDASVLANSTLQETIRAMEASSSQQTSTCQMMKTIASSHPAPAAALTTASKLRATAEPFRFVQNKLPTTSNLHRIGLGAQNRELKNKLDQQAEDSAHTQQALFNQLETERKKFEEQQIVPEKEREQSKRLQNKLGKVMVTLVANGLDVL